MLVYLFRYVKLDLFSKLKFQMPFRNVDDYFYIVISLNVFVPGSVE